jgi:DNA polymerase III subunit alpha
MVSKFSKLASSDYVHLHNHTQYSLLDGLTKIPALIDAVQAMGMESISITDHGTMSGVIEFYKKAKEKGVRPILGMETYVAPRLHTDKDSVKDKTPFHLILLAMNNTGYQNLMRLSSTANLDGFYYKPRVDHDLLEKYNEGLIVLSGCIGGEVGDALRQDQYDNAKQIASWYKQVFGDRYYLEVQDHGHADHPSAWAEQTKVNQQIFKLAQELDIQAALTCDAHYLKHSDQEAHEILLCVQTGSFITDEKRMSLKDFELHVTDPQEIIDRWGKDHPEVVSNTRLIAERCEVELELGKYLIPKFPVPKGKTEKSYLHELTYRGLVQRYLPDAEPANEPKANQKLLPAEVVDRASYELGVIDRMGFNGYFLIVQDFINWGKDQGIVFGPGRGSGAGSIIAYALRITELDPLSYDLLFERFLNPDRISMPDFDIDIQDTRRDEVIAYCSRKYGSDRVANIVTFGTMAARNAVRDVARVLQVPYADADRLAKMIPPPVQGRHIPLSVSLKDNNELKAEYESNQISKRVFDLAIQLEGTIRSHGVHAAGVVIAPDEIVKYTPLEMAQKGVVATQYSMGPIEDLGLLKMDFLGLSNLTIIKNALRIIKKVYKVDIDINSIPLNDSKTFELLSAGDTTGVFQLESAGMKRYLKELKPTVIDDIIAMVALYRPGPMQWIDDFIARKQGHKAIEFMHPSMEPALKNTYGVIVYQEQVMQISKEMCGFTGGQADTLRKAIGKKIPEVLKKMKAEFIEGAIKVSGADRRTMEKFWKQLEDFAAYCFNKSHAACYALIAYQTAYLKAHYPTAFMAALMTSDYDNIDRLAIEISECKHMGIEVQAPDVNESFVEFAVVPGSSPQAGQIRFGMNAIKNVGTGAVEEILRARLDKGKFATLEDFLASVNTRAVNRKAMESLIKSGAFDRFNNRHTLLASLDILMAYAARLQKQGVEGQINLFSEDEVDLGASRPSLNLTQEVSDYNERELIIWERELLGIYLSHHPLEPFAAILGDLTLPLSQVAASGEGKTVQAGGLVTDIRQIVTKNGQKMAFVKLADHESEIELLLFPNSYQQTEHLWEKDKVVVVKGRISSKGRDGTPSGEVKLQVNEGREISLAEAKNYRPKAKRVKKAQAAVSPAATTIVVEPKIYIRLESSNDQQLLMNIKSVIDAHSGATEVVLVVGNGNARQVIKLPIKMQPIAAAMAKLGDLVGVDNLKLN